jgi:hypothetical protein
MTTGRWSDYVLVKDEAFVEHWRDRFEDGAVLTLILGHGFDPRMCMALRALRPVAPKGRLRILKVVLGDRHRPDADILAFARRNAEEFASLTSGLDVAEIELRGTSLEDRARSAAGAFTRFDAPIDGTDILVDVSAMPRPVFFPLIAKLLYLCDDDGAAAPNLHVVAGNSAWLDELMVTEGIAEDATWLFPFGGTFSVEATEHVPRIWLPTLGEDTGMKLRRISNLVDPAEICPVLPFPSRDPRRADRLFEAYGEELFDRLRSDSGTVVHAAEANPFQVYRSLYRTAIYYDQTLKPLGGCKIAFSALSSKLAAIGVLLAAYELQAEELEIGVADIDAQGHRLSRPVSADEVEAGTSIVGLSLSGDSYL